MFVCKGKFGTIFVSEMQNRSRYRTPEIGTVSTWLAHLRCARSRFLTHICTIHIYGVT